MTRAQRKLLRLEQKELTLRPDRILRRVNAILWKQYGTQYKLPKATVMRMGMPADRIKPRDRDDKLRLTRLIVWQEIYHVDLEWILSAIIPELRKTLNRRIRGRSGCGVPIISLTSKRAENILMEKVARAFPYGEHEVQAVEDQRQLILRSRWEEQAQSLPRPTLASTGSTRKYMIAYRQRLRGEEGLYTRELGSATNRRRRYRGNPWI